ncbi:MAG: MFS transporter [Deltaproteobacteria bacterium]|nr:MFS transporter [Deltaproteobacteria bacterium]
MEPDLPLNPEDPKEPNQGRKTHGFIRRKWMLALQSFRYRDFRWLWLGSFASFTAVSMQQITRGWLVLKLTNDSPFALSLVMMSFAFPLTFASLIGGALADRLSKRWMIILTQSGNTVMTLILATLDITGLIRFWHLIVIGAINGTLAAFNMPSRQSIIADIVPEKDLMNAVSLNSSAMNLTRVIGPALAGLLIIYLDTAGVFYLIATVYFLSIILTALIQEGRDVDHQTNKSVGADIMEGFRYAKGNPIILGLLILSFVPALFGFPYIALLPAWAREALNVQSDGLGLLMMTMGIGSLAGTLMLASLRQLRRRRVFLTVNGLAWGLALILFSRTHSYTTAIPGLFFLGLANAVFMALNMTLMQSYASPEMRGRIISMHMMTFGIMPLSAVPFGAIAERIGTADSLQIGGSMLCLFVIIFFFSFPKFRRMDPSVAIANREMPGSL